MTARRRRRLLTSRLTVWMPAELDAWLTRSAKKTPCSKSELIRSFLRFGVREYRSRGVLIPKRVIARMEAEVRRGS